MASDIEKPRITELQVRMDCNGCVQKIRKALHGIHGIYEVYPDIAQQKLTVVGWADPDNIVKAIRKTRKAVTICSHSEAAAHPPEQLPGQGHTVAPEAGNPTQSEAPPPDEPAAAPAPPQPEAVAAEPPLENPQPEPQTPAGAGEGAGQHPNQPLGEVHVICHHPPDYGHRYGYVHSYGGGGPWGRQYPTCHSQCSFYPNSQPFHHEPQPQPQPPFVTHSYNTYKPSPYVTEYEYVRSPPRYSHYSRIDHYNDDYYSNYSYGNGNGNISSMFSDENPNSCIIM
ncbi:hypothetical protein HRI_003877500 [Hibiscus trionum]|uniref:HMA domain-containing protein n=1 Tax=Hibiscus trionum TaxID=183268 RepID=A0A9W7IW98_HIBTR|nr:hypothetical protein HRI_003877500 [Hibiscus trionum]